MDAGRHHYHPPPSHRQSYGGNGGGPPGPHHQRMSLSPRQRRPRRRSSLESLSPPPRRDDDRRRREPVRRRGQDRRGRDRSRSGSSGSGGGDRRRDISSSRARSRERERFRRKKQAECIKRAGGFQKLADSEGKEPVRLFWDGFQWVAKTNSSSALQSDPALMNSTRKLRRLYFGNLPLHLGLTESLFQDMLWLEMKQRGLCQSTGEQPVLCVWFAKDKGNYGFVEFASVEETDRALEHLDGMICMGVSLKVSRPNDYSGAGGSLSSAAVAAVVPGQAGGAAAAAPISGAVMSRVVCFAQIVRERDIRPEETWEDLLEDIKEGCGRHGKIASAFIVTPDLAGESPYNVGDAFLEFSEPAEAAACVRGMTGRRYLSRKVSPMPIDEAAYSQLIKPLAQRRALALAKERVESINNRDDGGEPEEDGGAADARDAATAAAPAAAAAAPAAAAAAPAASAAAAASGASHAPDAPYPDEQQALHAQFVAQPAAQ